MKIIFVALFVIVVLVIIDIADHLRIVTTKYSIKTDKIDENIRFVFLSDLHNNQFLCGCETLVKRVKEECPDFVVMGGDMLVANPGHDIDVPVKLVKLLKDFRIYYGIGNHEYRMKIYRDIYGDNYDRLKEQMKEAGVFMLENESEYYKNIQIQGLMLDRKYYRRFETTHMEKEYLDKLLGQKDDDVYRILLAHDPQYFEAYSKVSDLVLSGHVHGGVVRLPFIGGLVSTKFSLFPKYDAGEYECRGNKMIVSRGLGSHTIHLRLFNPAEIVVVDLVKE